MDGWIREAIMCLYIRTKYIVYYPDSKGEQNKLWPGPARNGQIQTEKCTGKNVREK